MSHRFDRSAMPALSRVRETAASVGLPAVSVDPAAGPLGPRVGNGGAIRLDVGGLDVIAPGVSVLAPRGALAANDGRIVLTETPTVRHVAEISGLQDLIETALAGSGSNTPSASVDLTLNDRRLPVSTIKVCAEVTIHADDLHAGDVVDFSGVLHRLTRVDRGAGLAWPVAYDGTGWAMALGHELIILHRTSRRNRS